MADLRAVVQYLGERVLGEKFDIDAFEVPPDVLAKIDRPSEEIAAVRGDFSRALEAVGLEVASLSNRVASLEKAPTILPPAMYDAAKRAVEARMATVVPDQSPSSALDHAAIAGLADRIDRLEHGMSHSRDELRAHIESAPLTVSTYSSASFGNEIAELRELVMAVMEYNEARDDLVETMGKSLRTQSERMQLVLARGQSVEAEMTALRSILDDVTGALDGIAGKLGQAQRRAG